MTLTGYHDLQQNDKSFMSISASFSGETTDGGQKWPVSQWSEREM